MTGLSVVCLLLLLALTPQVEGSCYMGIAEGNYCMAGETRIEMNDWYLTPDCFNCTCSEGFMSCCGVGIKAGAIGVPKGFRMQLIPPCDYIIVPDSRKGP